MIRFSRPGCDPLELSLQKKVEILDRTNWSYGMTLEEIEIFAAFTSPWRVRKGTVIFAQGDTENFLCLLSEGKISICIEDFDGNKKILTSIRPGKVFGEMSLIEGEPRSAAAIAAEDSLIHILSRDDFARLERDHPRVWGRLLWKIAKLLSQRLRQTSGKLADLL